MRIYSFQAVCPAFWNGRAEAGSTSCSIIPSLGGLLVRPLKPVSHDQDVKHASQHGGLLLLRSGSMVNPFGEDCRLPGTRWGFGSVAYRGSSYQHGHAKLRRCLYERYDQLFDLGRLREDLVRCGARTIPFGDRQPLLRNCGLGVCCSKGGILVPHDLC